MMNFYQPFTPKSAQGGFTLVELAIVMIIIGLLIGGILKGQELIGNAQTAATISQIKSIDGAVSTFRDKYAALPGDMRGPQNRLRNCTTSPCNVQGNGNSQIGVNPRVRPTAATQESVTSFVHMAAADLLTGIDTDSNGSLSFGSYLPEAKVGGGYWIGYSTVAAIGAGITNARPGHYLAMSGDLTANITGTTPVGVDGTTGAQIDRKLDDGNPRAGGVQATGQNCVRNIGGALSYDEANANAQCALLIRIQS